jgi:hypothetical protein
MATWFSHLSGQAGVSTAGHARRQVQAFNVTDRDSALVGSASDDYSFATSLATARTVLDRPFQSGQGRSTRKVATACPIRYRESRPSGND